MSARSATRFFDERDEGASGERWLLTYADMITLLLALFIVLFALSTIDKKKYEEFKTGVVQTFSPRSEPIPGGTGLLQQTSLVTHPGTTKTTVPNPLVNLEQRIQAALAQAGVSQDATVSLEPRGVVVRLLTDKVFFATYSATEIPPTSSSPSMRNFKLTGSLPFTARKASTALMCMYI